LPQKKVLTPREQKKDKPVGRENQLEEAKGTKPRDYDLMNTNADTGGGGGILEGGGGASWRGGRVTHTEHNQPLTVPYVLEGLAMNVTNVQSFRWSFFGRLVSMITNNLIKLTEGFIHLRLYGVEVKPLLFKS